MTADLSGHEHHERRVVIPLSEHEIEALADRIWNRFSTHFENIGYDLSTSDSRSAIRDDHKWVREWRTGANRAKATAIGAGIAAFISGALWLVWNAFKTAVSTLKGA